MAMSGTSIATTLNLNRFREWKRLHELPTYSSLSSSSSVMCASNMFFIYILSLALGKNCKVLIHVRLNGAGRTFLRLPSEDVPIADDRHHVCVW
jgi:hypothetical protein